MIFAGDAGIGRGCAVKAGVTCVLLAGLLAGCSGGSGQSPDPVVADFPIAYVKRPLDFDDQGDLVQRDLRRQGRFVAGGDLYLRPQATASAPERNITAAVTNRMGDVRDVEVSHDGSKLLFALRLPEIEDADEDEQPTWNIWEYDIATGTLRRIIGDDIIAESGQDIAPHYLPDGRIVFSSTRQRESRALLLDDGKPQFAGLTENLGEEAFVLHVMDVDGGNIHQVSFNQSHDLDPTVTADGKIVFSRWDAMSGRNAIHLYRMHPDGSELELLYGANSHATGSDGSNIQFTQPRPMPDGRLLTLLQPFTGTYGGGALSLIDVENYVDNTEPTFENSGILSGPAQEAATSRDVNTASGVSIGGRYRSAYPLWDGTGRMLVSWSPCRLIETVNEQDRIVPCTADRLQNPDAQEAPPLYGIWVYDRSAGTQLPVVAPQENIEFAEVVAAHRRDPYPPILYDKQRGVELDADLADQNLGLLHIKSVYDIDGTAAADILALRDPSVTAADARPARFLRILKAVAIPDDDVRDIPGTAFGISRRQLMREIIGYVPIEPDGSVMAKVPAGVPLSFEILDASGRRLRGLPNELDALENRHRTWLQLRAGETVTCNGCHDNGNDRSHGRMGWPSANPGAPLPNTVRQLLDNPGETMAEIRARAAASEPAIHSDGALPSVNIVFEDFWPLAPAAPFSYVYVDSDLDDGNQGLSTAIPTSDSCTVTWTARCRIVINYPTHIHPLWSAPRTVAAVDRTCTGCHTAEAVLDLTDGVALDEPDHLRAYRELLIPDDLELLSDNGTLAFAPVPESPAGRFMAKMAGGVVGETVNHAGFMTPGELKLVAEWLDIGAQYYNDPFAVPVN